MVELGEVCEVKRGSTITKKEVVEGQVPVIAGGKQPAYYHNKSNRSGNTITVSASGNAGFVNYFDIPIFASDCLTIQSTDENIALTKFVLYLLRAKQDEIYKLQTGTAQRHVYAKDLKGLKIPLPPLEVQEQIVAEMESEQKSVDGSQKLIEAMNKRITSKIDEVWGE